MKGKFSTTSSSLFNNNNSEQTPDWMQNLDINIKEKEKYNLDFETKGAFAEKTTIYRNEHDGTPRYLEASFNDTKLLTDAKIQLAKFLSGKYYKVEAKANGNSANLDVKIDGLPAQFTFNFSAKDGKLSNNTTFSVKYNGDFTEYPFNKAGFDECVNDIKSNKLKVSQKVEAVGKTFLINKEEIIRRYNGKLREATDKINELVKSGDIIGVGSNTFASFYDANYLFPQMEKEACEPPLPAFEFAPNTEHVAANPYVSEKVLAIEASKTLAQLFNDFRILNSSRDNNELLVKATILSNNGITKCVDFCFGIENEKVASLKLVELNDERMTIEQLLNKLNIGTKVLNAYLNNNNSAKRIYRGSVLTEREIAKRMSGIVRKNIIANIIENWVERDLIQPVNSTTFTTTKSFEELLASINTKVLNSEELEEIKQYQKKFGSGLEMERQNIEDTGIRDYDNIEISNEIRLANLNNYVSKYFKDFKISLMNVDIYSDVKTAKIGNDTIVLDRDMGTIDFTDSKTGTRHQMKIVASFHGNTPKDVEFYVGNSTNLVSINKLAYSFEKSKLLSAYLQDKNTNLVASSTVLSERNIKHRLIAFVNVNDIDNIINDWYKNNLISSIGNGICTSKYSFEELLNKTSANIMSENDRREIATIKKHFGEGLNVEREDVEDTGVREPDAYITDDTLLNTANQFLTKYFKNFQGEGFKIDNDVANYSVRIFDEESGLSTIINLSFAFDGNKVASVHVNLNNEKVSLNNIKRVFAMNESLSKYLELNPGKRTDAPMIMTIQQLKNKLSFITKAGLEEIEDTINDWSKAGKANKISSNVFASKYTLEQLISMSNIKPLKDSEIQDRIARSRRDRGLSVSANYMQNSDTRQLIDSWSPERMVLHAKSELNKLFKDYDILDAKINQDSYVITARVVNPYAGIKQKLNFTFAMFKDKPANLLKVSNNEKSVDVNNINELITNDSALKTFIQHNAVNQRNYKNLISKNQLMNKLSHIIDKDQIDTLTNSLVQNEILNPVNSFTFASNYSIAEIVTYLSKFGNTNLDIAQEQQQNAQRDEHTIKISDKRVMNNDSRTLEHQIKDLSPKMLNLRDKISTMANKAHSQKLITSNKLNQINGLLSSSKIEKDLEIAWRELKKYLS